MWVWALYTYATVGLAVGCVATFKNRWIFRHGSFRIARAVAHTIVVGLFWWIIGPLALGFRRRKYD